jgi:hypothetical protein
MITIERKKETYWYSMGNENQTQAEESENTSSH